MLISFSHLRSSFYVSHVSQLYLIVSCVPCVHVCLRVSCFSCVSHVVFRLFLSFFVLGPAINICSSGFGLIYFSFVVSASHRVHSRRANLLTIF